MNLDRVNDLSIKEVLKRSYDLGIFASGYENRAFHLASKIDVNNFRDTLIFGFTDVEDQEARSRNDKLFLSKFRRDINLISKNDDGAVYNHINNWRKRNNTRNIRILVDYSSMSRVWYTAILNWITFQQDFDCIEVDFCYSIGEYKDDFAPLITENIIALPGFEGASISQSKSVCIFGLGFDGAAALCALDRIEPDIVHTFIASPASFPEYTIKAFEENQELIEQSGTGVVLLPLSSIENSFRYLGELVSTYLNNSYLTFIPMGPKPHILTALLVALRFKEITCLHVTGRRERPQFNIKPTDDFVAVNISFLKDT